MPFGQVGTVLSDLWRSATGREEVRTLDPKGPGGTLSRVQSIAAILYAILSS
jgi:hypothetical protein